MEADRPTTSPAGKTTTYRLRQVAFVTHALEKTVDRLNSVFGLKVGYRDPTIKTYGLFNAVLPAGNDFIEIVQSLTHATPAKRYLDRRSGETGYMLILQAEDAIAHRRRLSEKGVFGIDYMGGEPYGARRPPISDPMLKTEIERFSELHHATHFHPKDLAGVLASIDSVPGATDWRKPDSDWFPAGPDWRAAKSPFCFGIAGASIQSRDPQATAKIWAGFLDLPLALASAVPAIDLGTSRLKFVEPVDADATGIIGLDLWVADPDEAHNRAKQHEITTSAGAIVIGGVAIHPVNAG